MRADPRVNLADHFMASTEESECTFWFVLAENIRELTHDRLPALQELLHDRSSWMVKKKITLVDALHGAYCGEYLFISHRWETPEAPDPNGVQLRRVKDHVRRNPLTRFVWYDFWCMPQKLDHQARSATDQAEFDRMLPNIPLLCLGCSVLVVLDLQYMGRFWTQFEAWLSLQRASAEGLAPDLTRIRCTVCKIHNATLKTEENLYELWAGKNAQEAYDTLAKDDVYVTNRKDKELQLPKLKWINETVGAVWAREGPMLMGGPTTQAATEVFLVGDTPAGLQRANLGAYSLYREGALINDHPAYEKVGDKDTMLWFDGNDTWLVGDHTSLGNITGTIRCVDNAIFPDRVTAQWEVRKGTRDQTQWVNASQLQCAC
jgi:hypothetical protein